MISARIFILAATVISQAYNLMMSHIADIQRKKPLPEEVADIYDKERYQTYLDYTADRKKLRNKYKIIDMIINLVLIFSPMYAMIDSFANGNPYIVFFITYAIIWVIAMVTDTWLSYKMTFDIMERYGLNKKDMKEFVKDLVLEQALELVFSVVLGIVGIFIGEHMASWTNNFSTGWVKSIIICVSVVAVVYVIMCLLRLLSYAMLKKQYVFTPMEEGELKDKINKLQEGCKKKVKEIYVYNESKKTTTKNAFLLKLFWHREFGIADNFMNENAEDELLAVLSHEVGHLKHKKDLRNFIGYGLTGLLFAGVVCLIAKPDICLWINAWIRDSFNVNINNYYLIIVVYGYFIKPIGFLFGIYGTYKTRCEEYEADQEAVHNGYGEALIKTFKTLSSDELVNVNPHPVIEFLEYDHPGMYQRIKAIRKGISY